MYSERQRVLLDSLMYALKLCRGVQSSPLVVGMIMTLSMRRRLNWACCVNRPLKLWSTNTTTRRAEQKDMSCTNSLDVYTSSLSTCRTGRKFILKNCYTLFAFIRTTTYCCNNNILSSHCYGQLK